MTKSVFSRRDLLRLCASLPFSLATPRLLHADSNETQGPKGFGVNCFDLFLGRLLRQNGVRSPGVRLRELADIGVSFVRFPVSVFWPNQWRLFTEERERYFDYLDEVVWAAENHGVTLVPTFFWNVSSVSDLSNEPVSAWGDNKSKTSVFAAKFVNEIVRRYRLSKAFSAWEFANEVNTYADLPNGHKWWPKIAPLHGTPANRTNVDVISSRDIVAAVSRFTDMVKQIVPNALISGGFDAPRINANNLSRGKSFADTANEVLEHQIRLNQNLDMISLHLYPGADSRSPMMLRSNYAEELARFVEIGKLSGKSVFLGEFGIRRSGSDLRDRSNYERLLAEVVESGVRSAALWVYDYPIMKDWSVSLHGDRSYQLEFISKYAHKY